MHNQRIYYLYNQSISYGDFTISTALKILIPLIFKNCSVCKIGTLTQFKL